MQSVRSSCAAWAEQRTRRTYEENQTVFLHSRPLPLLARYQNGPHLLLVRKAGAEAACPYFICRLFSDRLPDSNNWQAESMTVQWVRRVLHPEYG